MHRRKFFEAFQNYYFNIRFSRAMKILAVTYLSTGLVRQSAATELDEGQQESPNKMHRHQWNIRVRAISLGQENRGLAALAAPQTWGTA